MSDGHAFRIKGNPGSDPQSGSGNPVAPASSLPNTSVVPEGTIAVLKADRGALYVDVRGERIPVDPASVKRVLLLSSLGGPVNRVEIVAPDALSKAIGVAQGEVAELKKPGVLNVRAGYQFVDGRITKNPCIVVEVDPAAKAPELPPVWGGLPVEVVPADPYEQLASRDVLRTETGITPTSPLLIDTLQQDGVETEEVARNITYEPPRGASLPEVRTAMAITCHVSPDAGWHVLEPFLKATKERFVLGMYDFTAPHIFQAARSLLRDSDVVWEQTLGPNESLPSPDDENSNKANDMTEASIVAGLNRVAKGRFESTFASVGSGKTFASAYHIKVGVQDRKIFWLSSGNWQSSNQPDIDFLDADSDRKLIASYNREWHVLVENDKLADIFQTYLEGDFTTASQQQETGFQPEAAKPQPTLLVPEDELLTEERAAANIQVFAPKRFVFSKQTPLTVQPILSPDNYVEMVLGLLRKKPQKTLYFQNQSLNPVQRPTEEFQEMMELLIGYSNDASLDVRLIFRNIGPVRKKLESLQAAGFNMDRIRMQAGCHTKGIIVDSEVILLGSHNFTNDGVQFNRDASLLISDAGIAQYYQDVFLHDWDRLARATIRTESVRLADGQENAPAGFVRVPWSYYDESD